MTDDFRARLNSALAPQYSIERELQGGGMSHVYVAMEHSLGRRVVIKVLPPDLAAGVNRERFEREIQLAAQLQHPHIVPLLSAGEVERSLYYTMPFIEGESLRVIAARQRRLPVRDVVRILHDVVEALAYAHGRGVIHRDIKPGNILTLGSHALVTDFGVAKAISASLPRSGSTSAGMAIGTPAYMAPEQIAADPEADHRMDVYAVGLLAYELLSGDAPFGGMSPQENMARQLTSMPDELRTVRDDVPPALSAVIMRCLEKRPLDRPQSADQLLDLLEGVTTPRGGSLTGAGSGDGGEGGSGDATLRLPASAPPRRRRPSGAVLAASLILVSAVAATANLLLKDRPSAGASVAADSANTLASGTDSGGPTPDRQGSVDPQLEPATVLTLADSIAIAEAVLRRLNPGTPPPTDIAGASAPESLIARYEQAFADSMVSVSEALGVARALRRRGFNRFERLQEYDSLAQRAVDRARAPIGDASGWQVPLASAGEEPGASIATRIVVLPATNASRDRALDNVIRLIADTVRTLFRVNGLRVGELTAGQLRAVRLRPATARELGFGIVVRELGVLRRDSVTLALQLVDTRSGRMVRTLNGSPAPLADALRGVERLVQQAAEQIQALAVLPIERRPQFPRRRVPPDGRPGQKDVRLPDDR